jgi:hypothetical protein
LLFLPLLGAAVLDELVVVELVVELEAETTCVVPAPGGSVPIAS